MSSGTDSLNHEHPHNHSHDHDHDHDHGHGHFHFHGKDAPRAIVRAIAITVFFMIVEAVGGFLSNSLALLSDAGHMLTDVGAMLLSLFAIWVARKPSTSIMSYGFHRAEILGALASGLLIWLISGLLVYEAILRLQSPEEVQAKVLLIVATIGLLANLVSMKLLHSEKEHNINVRAAYLHLLADTLGSVGAILAGVILIFTGWRPIDPIITILFSVLMLYSSWNLMKESVQVLMESTPPGIDPEKIRADLAAIEGVREVHDLHVWSVSSGRLALSVHLISTHPEVLSAANAVLKDHYGIIHTTIQVEHPDRFASERCYDCGDSGH